MVFQSFIQLLVLFFVIIDPMASFMMFFTASSTMVDKERRKVAYFAILLAAGLSMVVIIFGQNLLRLFSTNIEEFKVAGGIVLGILGIKMILGGEDAENIKKGEKGRAVAAIIATPMLTGPATITAIIISVQEKGMVLTSLAVGIVLVLTAILFLSAKYIRRFVNETAVHVTTTILGLITLAWAVKFITEGLIILLRG
jgi:multiple antibiotic resistance protein